MDIQKNSTCENLLYISKDMQAYLDKMAYCGKSPKLESIHLDDEVMEAYIDTLTVVTNLSSFGSWADYNALDTKKANAKTAINQVKQYTSEDGTLTYIDVSRWLSDLDDQGYADRTISAKRCIIDDLFRFVSMEIQNIKKDINKMEETVIRQIRSPYIQYIESVTVQNNPIAHVLAEALTLSGLCPEELSHLNVNTCKTTLENGCIYWNYSEETTGIKHNFFVPKELAKDVLSYSLDKGYVTNTVFDKSLDSVAVDNILYNANPSIACQVLNSSVEIGLSNVFHDIYVQTMDYINKDTDRYRATLYEEILSFEP